ncbi:MAG: hypothetical protein K0S41_1147 [Anaerocolumna sp.]|jgi:hypothetical protein|nr:hypothetical protein [Anaerocolumna sp.]
MQEKQINETFKDLEIGIACYGVIYVILGIIIAPNKLPFLFGALLGLVIAYLLSIHLYVTIHKSVEMDEKRATNYTRAMAGVRITIMIVAIVLALTFPDIFNSIAVLLGILGLKIAAYIEPIISNILNKNLRKGR